MQFCLLIYSSRPNEEKMFYTHLSLFYLFGVCWAPKKSVILKLFKFSKIISVGLNLRSQWQKHFTWVKFLKERFSCWATVVIFLSLLLLVPFIHVLLCNCTSFLFMLISQSTFNDLVAERFSNNNDSVSDNFDQNLIML